MDVLRKKYKEDLVKMRGTPEYKELQKQYDQKSAALFQERTNLRKSTADLINKTVLPENSMVNKIAKTKVDMWLMIAEKDPNASHYFISEGRPK